MAPALRDSAWEPLILKEFAMVMDAYYAVEIECRKCGRRFIGTFAGPDAYTTQYNLCPDCYEEASEEELRGFNNYAD